MKLELAKLAMAAIAAAALSVSSNQARAAGKNLLETAEATSKLNTLVTAIDAAGLTGTLSGPGPFTVFAPTDAAFAKLPRGTVESLLKPENKARLTAILTYHVVPGAVMAADVTKLKQVKTVNGQTIAVKADHGAVMINNAKVTATDIVASNGVIHVIDHVILPPNG